MGLTAYEPGGSGPAAAGAPRLQQARVGSLESAPGCQRVAACSRSLVGCSRSHLEASLDSGYARASARESCQRQEPMAAGRASGSLWVPGSAQSFEGPCGQYRGPGPVRNWQEGPAQVAIQPGPSESSQTRRKAAADQVSHRLIQAGDLPRRIPAIFPAAIFPGDLPRYRRRSSPVTVDTRCGKQVVAEHRKQHDFKATPVMPCTRMRETARGGTRKRCPAGPEF
jgi:hypothetical protein